MSLRGGCSKTMFRRSNLSIDRLLRPEPAPSEANGASQSGCVAMRYSVSLRHSLNDRVLQRSQVVYYRSRYVIHELKYCILNVMSHYCDAQNRLFRSKTLNSISMQFTYFIIIICYHKRLLLSKKVRLRGICSIDIFSTSY